MKAKLAKVLSKTHLLFAAIALSFGLIYIISIPPLWGLDEPSHFYRTYQIAQGKIIPERGLNNYGGSVPKNLYDLGNYTIGDLVDNDTSSVVTRKDVDNKEKYLQLTSVPFSVQKHSSPSASSYSPVAYMPSVVGVMVSNVLKLSIGHTLFMARLFSLIAYVLIISFALKLIEKSKIRWIIFTVALFPASLSQASVVTADGMLIALSLLFISLFFRLVHDENQPQKKILFYALIVVSVLLPLVKLNYIFLSFGLLLVTNNLVKSKKITLFIKTAGIMTAILLGLVWSLLSKVTADSQVSQRPDGAKVFIADQIAFVLDQPIHFFAAVLRSVVVYGDAYLHQLTTLISWNYVTLPLSYILLLCLGLFISSMYAKEELLELRSKLLFFNVSVAAGVISIFFTLYVAFTPVRSVLVEGVQGRYFLPFIIPPVLFIASILPIKITIKEKTSPLVFASLSTVVLVASVVYYNLVTY